MLDSAGVKFLEHATEAVQRILPHVEVSAWSEIPWKESESVWESAKRAKIRMTLAIGERGASDAKSLEAFVERKRSPTAGGSAGRSLDPREYDICKRIILRTSEVLKRATSGLRV